MHRILRRRNNTVTGLICSFGKFEVLCIQFVIAENNVYNITCLLKSDVSAEKNNETRLISQPISARYLDFILLTAGLSERTRKREKIVKCVSCRSEDGCVCCSIFHSRIRTCCIFSWGVVWGPISRNTTRPPAPWGLCCSAFSLSKKQTCTQISILRRDIFGLSKP